MWWEHDSVVGRPQAVLSTSQGCQKAQPGPPLPKVRVSAGALVTLSCSSREQRCHQCLGFPSLKHHLVHGSMQIHGGCRLENVPKGKAVSGCCVPAEMPSPGLNSANEHLVGPQREWGAGAPKPGAEPSVRPRCLTFRPSAKNGKLIRTL